MPVKENAALSRTREFRPLLEQWSYEANAYERESALFKASSRVGDDELAKHKEKTPDAVRERVTDVLKSVSSLAKNHC